jgi:hypothetical protein
MTGACGELDAMSSAGNPVIIGGLDGELVYDDDAFAEVDPDIQNMFYGEDVAAP